MPGEGSWVGLDVHARSVIGCAIDESAGEIRSQRIGARNDQIVDWVRAQPGPVVACYEAGPTGFGLARALHAAGVPCEVVAPSKLERPAGDKVKTDRRDAERLARLLRIGELPGVRVPTEAEEAARDLVRAREDCRGDLMRARHRLSKLLLRQGLVWEHSAWTGAHEDWLRSHRFDRRGVQLAFDEALDTVFTVHARRDRLDAAIEEMAATEPLAGPVGRLRCLRGVSTLTATALCVEVADWHRFTGSTIGAYLGLVPSEFSSGARRVQGPITKTGNGHARRLLVEAAWHHRRPLRASRERARRADGQPAAVRDRAEAGNRRLHQRWCRLEQRGKRPTISAVAVARELAGWCWSLAMLDQDRHDSPAV
ncbi:IS110 family transposase [Actinomycetospora chibensis]|uniref:IS110 family transposase n=1 Tax=Actinomycetospora chibensis TaxID=663606 RepID=A0ABV9RTM3_9PSEU|nr:IS110 family transposase [Actinomycetospora chibensis]MDD7926452.1 IS110 family transposase [Actinomycetospora chibensis]